MLPSSDYLRVAVPRHCVPKSETVQPSPVGPFSLRPAAIRILSADLRGCGGLTGSASAVGLARKPADRASL
jgi:hypothetical protein